MRFINISKLTSCLHGKCNFFLSPTTRGRSLNVNEKWKVHLYLPVILSFVLWLSQNENDVPLCSSSGKCPIFLCVSECLCCDGKNATVILATHLWRFQDYSRNSPKNSDGPVRRWEKSIIDFYSKSKHRFLPICIYILGFIHVRQESRSFKLQNLISAKYTR